MSVPSERSRNLLIPLKGQDRRRLLRTSLFFFPTLLIGLHPPPLAADCQVELATGAIVTCTAIDTNGVATGALNDTVTVEVDAEVVKSDARTAAASVTAGATAIGTDGGNDRIVNNGAVQAEVTVVLDPPDVLASWLGSNGAPEGFVATAAAVGIDSGASAAAATDTVINSGTLDIVATAGVNGGDIQLDLFDATDLDVSLTARATAVGLQGATALAVANTGEIAAIANAGIVSWTGEVNALDEATANTTGTPLATAVGIGGGSGFATIVNSGSIAATAEAGAIVAIAEVNVVDLAVAGAGIGSGPESPMRAEATGIYAGDGGSEITNSSGGDITASAHSIATIDNIVLTLYDFTIVTDFRRNAGTIACYIDAVATGIGGGDGSDRITNNGTISAKAETDVVSVGLGVGAEGVPAGTISGYFSMFYAPADATINGAAGTVSTADSAGIHGAIGIDGGGGNDTLTNNGTLTVTADSDVWSTGLSVSFPLLELSGLAKPWNDFPPAFAIAATGTSAEANAPGIVGGEGADTIVNLAPAGAGIEVNATAKSHAIQASVALQSVKTPSAEPYFLNFDIALANATALAAAEATGIEGGPGNDSLANGGPLAVLADAEAYSSGGSVVVEGLKGMTGLGVSIVRTQLQTEATASAEGMIGGEGNDTILNTDNCTVDAEALGNSLSIGISVQGAMKGIGAGGAFADLATASTAEALGLSGDAGDDLLINSASDPESLHVHAQSKALAESFAVKLQQESEGVEIAASLTDASVTGWSTAVGWDGGAGNDALTNYGKAEILAETLTENLAVDVQVQTSVKGLGIQGSFIDGSSTGTATALGMQGGTGNDMLTNTTADSLTVRAEADVYAQLIAAHITAESTGVTLDGALAKANSTASSTATGMAGGMGGDTLINGGDADITADSTANSLALSLTLNAEVVGLGVQAALTDTSTFADATALGMAGGEGGDTLINQYGATLTTEAGATAASSSIAASITGETAGVTLAGSLARATTTPTATATGLTGGAGDDLMYNLGRAEVAADTDSTSVAVGVTAAGVTKGVSVGASLTDTSAVATATALGMDGGDGSDTIGNYGTLQVEANSVLRAASVSFHYGGLPIGVTAGAALARAGTQATDTATGIQGGAGDDTIVNATGALVDVDAKATSTSTAVAITADVLGYAWTDTSTSTDLRTVGIDGGSGNNTLTNLGRIEADTLATGNASSYSLNLGMGGSSAKTFTEVSAAVVGLAAGAGNDILTNGGAMSLFAQSTFNAVEVSFALAGFSTAKADNTATAIVTGIDAGDGVNTVLNRSGGSIDAIAESAATTRSSSITIGISGVDGTSKAIAGARGIATGDGGDAIDNDGIIEAAVKVTNVSGNSTLSLAGFSNQDATLGGTAEGIVSGGGNDTIWNTGTITVGGVDADPMVNVEALSLSFLDLVSIDSNQFDARAGAFGIVAGAGDDTIVNQGGVTVGSDSSMAKGKAGGYTFTAATLFDMSTTRAQAETSSTGIDGGEGADTLINGTSGRLEVFATSEGGATSAGAELASFFATYSATTRSQAAATGMAGGNGADIVDNFGVLHATADTSADATSHVYAAAALLATNATADASAQGYGLDVGSGWNLAYNVGNIVVETTATATSTAGANTDFGPNSADATSAPVAKAAGIVAGESGGVIVNDSGGTVRVFASAFGPATASADEEADALADLSATVWGIQVGAGAHVIRNLGEITANAATGATDSSPDAQANASSVDDAQATARRKGTAAAMGIGLGDGNNDVENGGALHVQVANTGYALAGWHDDHLDRAYAYVGAGGSSLLATATGIGGGSGNNTLVHWGDMEVESTLTVWATAYADTTSDPNAARAYAGGTALANGISTGNGANRIDLFGDVAVHATATATAYGSGEDFGEAYVGIANTAGIIADARGVVVGNGSNAIVNTATLQVTAQSTASSSGITDDDDDFSAAVANAQAKAYGIFTGNGNNALINFGSIRVTAEAQATAVSTTAN